jgi:hypothetical protein
MYNNNQTIMINQKYDFFDEIIDEMLIKIYKQNIWFRILFYFIDE